MEVHLRQYEKEFNSWISVFLVEAKGYQVLNCQWIFVYKTDKYSRLTKYKVRLIVRKDQQHKYNLSTKATILVTTSFRTLLALIAKFDLEILQIDAVNTFIYIDLDELVYIRNLLGFPILKTIFKFNKTLYNFKKSPLL